MYCFLMLLVSLKPGLQRTRRNTQWQLTLWSQSESLAARLTADILSTQQPGKDSSQHRYTERHLLLMAQVQLKTQKLIYMSKCVGDQNIWPQFHTCCKKIRMYLFENLINWYIIHTGKLWINQMLVKKNHFHCTSYWLVAN